MFWQKNGNKSCLNEYTKIYSNIFSKATGPIVTKSDLEPPGAEV